MQSAAALENFIPAREGVYDGGECTGPIPYDGGPRAFAASFPNRREAETAITVWFHDGGQLARYTEARGVRITQNQADNAEMARTPRVVIQYDFVKNEAVVLNTPLGAGASGIRGTISEFEKSGVFGDVRKRAHLIRDLCKIPD